MQLEVITPDKTLFKGNAEAVSFPGSDGSFQVLKGHAPIISSLKDGKIKIDLQDDASNYDEVYTDIEKDSSNKRVIRLAIKGGVVEMQNDRIIVLAD